MEPVVWRLQRELRGASLMPVPQPADGSRSIYQSVLAALGGILPVSGTPTQPTTLQDATSAVQTVAATGGGSAVAAPPVQTTMPDIASIISSIVNSAAPTVPTASPAPATRPSSGGGGSGSTTTGPPPLVWTNPQGQVIDPVTGMAPGVGARPPITWGRG